MKNQSRFNDHMRGPSEKEGMGGFLDPPDFPTHRYSIGEGSRKDPSGLSSLHVVINEDPSYIDPEIKRQARALIASWFANKPAIDRPDVVAWIADCQRYWQGCWYSAVADRYGSHAWSSSMSGRPGRQDDAIDYATYHVRKFYPEYLTTDADAVAGKA